MTDEIDGPIVESEVAPAPSERPAPAAPSPVADEKSRDELVREQFAGGLALTAHGTEDATDYVKERQTQEKFLAGEDLSGAQAHEWHERTQTALRRAIDAAARARGEVPPSQQQQQAPQEAFGYVAPDAPDYDQRFAEAAERFKNYFDSQEPINGALTTQEHKDSITHWLTTYDPKSVLTGHFLASPLGPQMAEALEAEPDAITYLANLPPAARSREMAKLEGYVHAQQVMKQQTQEPQPRRFTAAPPPIRPPKGAANPPKDVRALANKDNVEDYVKARRQEDRRYREKWE